MLLSGLFSIAAQAANTSNIKVSANAQKGCEISAEDVNFGSLDETNRKASASMPIVIADVRYDSRLKINVKCSKTTTYNLMGEKMKNSPEFSGRYGQFMVGAKTGKPLQYGLWILEGTNKGKWFSDGTSIAGWSSAYITGTGTGIFQVHTVFVGLYSVQNNGFELIPDTYSDNYTVTVSY